MSRTRKGSKGPGHEYWSARPGGIASPGAPAKRRTHRAERQLNKAEARREARAPQDP